MSGSYFSSIEQGVIAGSMVLTLGACWAFYRGRDRWALVLLLVTAFALRLMASQLDPYLNTWDESVHAVVAKNMVRHPFTPMLFTDTAIGLSTDWWTATHVWLHKQPFFLWMMALSISTFGNNLFALRLPSVLFTTALVYFTHGIARAMHGRLVAFAAAMLMSWSFWFLMLVLGAAGIDHNDAIFLSLVGGAFWAWFRWRDRMSMGRSMVIGLFMGCAVLTKWLPGLLLMGGWSAVVLIEPYRRSRELRWMATALCTASVVAIPWQISVWVRFPEEMQHEIALNNAHLWTVVEGHQGDGWFYFRSIVEQFDPFGPWLVFGTLLLSILSVKRRDFRSMALVSVLVTYGFYSLAVTKMSAFTMVVIPFFYVGLGWLIEQVVLPVRKGRVQLATALSLSLVGAGSLFHMERIQGTHTEQAMHGGYYKLYRGAHMNNLAEIGKLQKFVGNMQHVILYHVPFPANMDMMFFHGHQVLQNFPTPEKAAELLALGRKVIIVDPPPQMVSCMPDGVEYYFPSGRGFQEPP